MVGEFAPSLHQVSPNTRLMQSTVWMLLRTLLMYAAIRLALVGCWPSACTTGFMALRMRSCSSEAYRLGTSPEFRMLLMSSRKDSLLICRIHPNAVDPVVPISSFDAVVLLL